MVGRVDEKPTTHSPTLTDALSIGTADLAEAPNPLVPADGGDVSYADTPQPVAAGSPATPRSGEVRRPGGPAAAEQPPARQAAPATSAARGKVADAPRPGNTVPPVEVSPVAAPLNSLTVQPAAAPAQSDNPVVAADDSHADYPFAGPALSPEQTKHVDAMMERLGPNARPDDKRMLETMARNHPAQFTQLYNTFDAAANKKHLQPGQAFTAVDTGVNLGMQNARHQTAPAMVGSAGVAQSHERPEQHAAVSPQAPGVAGAGGVPGGHTRETDPKDPQARHAAVPGAHPGAAGPQQSLHTEVTEASADGNPGHHIRVKKDGVVIADEIQHLPRANGPSAREGSRHYGAVVQAHAGMGTSGAGSGSNPGTKSSVLASGPEVGPARGASYSLRPGGMG